MSIQTFIQQEILAPRLSKRGVLVVYDPERRYRETCLALADKRYEVVDASESSILSREQASQALVVLGKGQLDKRLVYVPVAQPLTEEAKQADPFAAYGACGEVFPAGDSDSFLSLCLKAKPDQTMAIRQIFESDPKPELRSDRCSRRRTGLALKSKTPMQAMKEWYASRPDLFTKRPYNRPGCDSYESVRVSSRRCVVVLSVKVLGLSAHGTTNAFK